MAVIRRRDLFRCHINATSSLETCDTCEEFIDLRSSFHKQDEQIYLTSPGVNSKHTLNTEDETLGLGICCRHFTGVGTRSRVHTTVIEFICTVHQREGLKVFQFLLSIYSTNFSMYVCPKHHFLHRCPRCVVCLLSCVEIKPFRG